MEDDPADEKSKQCARDEGVRGRFGVSQPEQSGDVVDELRDRRLVATRSPAG